MTCQPLGIPNPAISDEVEEGRPWWKICCAGCCLGIIVIVVLLIVGLRWVSGPGPQRLTTVPASFPKDLTLFRPEEAREILYYSASTKNRLARIVSAPYGWLKGVIRQAPEATPLAGYSVTATAETLQRAVESRLSAFTDFETVALRWSNLQASQDEVLRFYAGSLMQVGIGNPQARKDPSARFLELAGASPRLRVSLLLVDEPATAGIDNVTAIVEYPSPKNP